MSIANVSEKLVGTTSIEVAVKTDLPTLGAVSKHYDTNFVEMYIKLWLADLNEITGVKNPLNIGQIRYIAQKITQEFRNLTIADVYLIFDNAKSGVYGKLYERLSPVDVLIWFRDYFKERCDVCARNSIEEHQRMKESAAEPRNSEMTVKGMLKKMKDEK